MTNDDCDDVRVCATIRTNEVITIFIRLFSVGRRTLKRFYFWYRALNLTEHV